jgi:hypothetical protein
MVHQWDFVETLGQMVDRERSNHVAKGVNTAFIK